MLRGRLRNIPALLVGLLAFVGYLPSGGPSPRDRFGALRLAHPEAPVAAPRVLGVARNLTTLLVFGQLALVYREHLARVQPQQARIRRKHALRVALRGKMCVIAGLEGGKHPRADIGGLGGLGKRHPNGLAAGAEHVAYLVVLHDITPIPLHLP